MMMMICLIVDDDQDTRDTVSMLLSSHSTAIRTTASLYGALDILRDTQERVDLMFLDWNLPGMPMKEFLDEVKRIRPNVTIVLSTAAFRVKEKALEHGLDWYLPKPIIPEDLVQLVSNISKRRSSGNCGAA
jgi:DNA-binding response OmpR family regulator